MAKRRSLPSVMKNHFSSLPNVNMRRSAFDRSFGLKSTFDVDYLVPIFVDEVVCGDSHMLSATHLARLTTLVQPIMDNLSMTTQFFYVPNRLVFDNWEDFITGGDQPSAWTSDNPTKELFVPQRTADGDGYKENSIYDYMGLPTKVANFRHNVLPLRCYNLIFNEYYRDENLQDSLPVWTGDADPMVDPDTGEESQEDNAVPYEYKLMKRNKRYDYFTSALPGLQKGPSVGIGVAGGDSGRLPVHGLAIASPNLSELGIEAPEFALSAAFGNSGTGSRWTADGSVTEGTGSVPPGTSGNFIVSNPQVSWKGTTNRGTSSYPSITTPFTSENFPIYVDIGSSTSVTINALRNAITLQRWFEKAARYGTRYVESMQGYFGVNVGDYRAQRPIYLGGSKSYISVNPVVQTSSTDNVSPQGNLSSYALSSDTNHIFKKSFVEHGWIIGIACVTADLTYQQGLERQWSRFSRYDYLWPDFAHLGEQPIYNKEIYCQSDSVKNANGVSVNDLPFGYQERYAEYRHKPSKITGLFRSNATGTLDSWHLSQNFANLPTLNETFIQCNTPIDRALAVPDQPDILCDYYFKYTSIRCLPTYSVPGLRRL